MREKRVFPTLAMEGVITGQGMGKVRGRKPTAALMLQTTWKTMGRATQEQHLEGLTVVILLLNQQFFICFG